MRLAKKEEQMVGLRRNKKLEKAKSQRCDRDRG